MTHIKITENEINANKCNYTYGNWSECPTECTTQTNMRFRIGTLVGSPSVQYHCLNETTEEGYCDDVFCPTTPPSWSTWSNCTTNDPCVVGSRIRERGQCNETNPDDSVITEPCVEECTSCEYDDWFDWSNCTTECGQGIEMRTRNILSGNETQCTDTVETRDCTATVTCPPACNIGGQSYAVGDPIPSDDHECDMNGNKACYDDPNRVVHGNYGQWTDWSECSLTCEGGQQTRTRTCSDPMPECGGNDCSSLGNDTETRSCNNDDGDQYCNEGLFDFKNCMEELDPCNTTCKMSDWSDWTPCSETCGLGTTTRTRVIYDPTNPDCNLVQDQQSDTCFFSSCPCGTNMEWSNTTSCSMYCNSAPNCTDNEQGCVCKPGYFMDELNNCVSSSDCSRCVHNGNYIPEDHQWRPLNDSCSICTCLEGSIECTKEQCNNPECGENEEEIIDPLNPCCKTCKTKTETCQPHTEFKVLETGNCVATQPRNVTYCKGGCLDSYAIPLLTTDTSSQSLDSACKCCIPTASHTETVELICNDDPNNIVYANLMVITSCGCDLCTTSEESASYAASQMAKRRRR
ncbi:hypothetical protein KUTeg_008148 [Tegillarca granosa]|uniref:CTCK domain-containing protein n=1 Tax=Tegillarca granosa TaxID=220873 RepID=A0ABQ9FCK9_TEGGR|nr:hypothetical protein KUTeg_008148 [Tegillarca granosa]